MPTPAYVNIHGQPLGVSARDAVLAVNAAAVCAKSEFKKPALWTVRRSGHRAAAVIGTGANKESAWRDAWSRMLVESMKSEKVPA